MLITNGCEGEGVDRLSLSMSRLSCLLPVMVGLFNNKSEKLLMVANGNLKTACWGKPLRDETNPLLTLKK